MIEWGCYLDIRRGPKGNQPKSLVLIMLKICEEILPDVQR